MVGFWNLNEMLKQDRDEMAEIIEHLDVLAYRMQHLEQLIQRAFGPEIK
jgi:uncharacterized coiled-coil protein SlyX